MKPEVVLPGIVSVEHVLARSDEAVVAVSGMAGYPTGFEFTLAAVLRVERRGPLTAHTHWLDPEDPLPDRFLRVGVEFSDGRRATNVSRRGPVPLDPSAQPSAPMLMMHGGGGSGRRQDFTYWVWPLPPPGPLALVCEWPVYAIGESRIEIDAALILDASTRAIRLWPDDPDDLDDGSDGPIASMFAADR
jgi:hypothetical protein